MTVIPRWLSDELLPVPDRTAVANISHIVAHAVDVWQAVGWPTAASMQCGARRGEVDELCVTHGVTSGESM